jgi:hypothetical protein
MLAPALLPSCLPCRFLWLLPPDLAGPPLRHRQRCSALAPAGCPGRCAAAGRAGQGAPSGRHLHLLINRGARPVAAPAATPAAALPPPPASQLGALLSLPHPLPLLRPGTHSGKFSSMSAESAPSQGYRLPLALASSSNSDSSSSSSSSSSSFDISSPSEASSSSEAPSSSLSCSPQEAEACWGAPSPACEQEMPAAPPSELAPATEQQPGRPVSGVTAFPTSKLTAIATTDRWRLPLTASRGHRVCDSHLTGPPPFQHPQRVAPLLRLP